MLTSRIRILLPSSLLLTRTISSTFLMSSPDRKNLIPPTSEGIALGASLIKEGQLVAFPTETVYGLGANALDAQACTSIFIAKGRPMTDPLIVHVANPSLAFPLVSISGPTQLMFERLAAKFWPGPLTIIVKAASCVPPEVTAKTGFVGIRCPSHPLALTFLAACGLPVAAPSANLFGHVSPTLSQHVLDDLGGKGVRVLDGDSEHSAHTCLHGIESTVVKIDENDCNDSNDSSINNGMKRQITLLRQGAVSQAQLERLAESQCQGGNSWSVVALQRQVHMDSSKVEDNSTAAPASTCSDTDGTCNFEEEKCAPDVVQSEGEVAPGQSLTHYAPYIPCYAVASCHSDASSVAGFNAREEDTSCSHKVSTALEKYCQKTVSISLADLKTVVIIDFLGQLSHYSPYCLAYRDLSVSGDATAAAKELFSSLRWAELQPNATQVFVAPIVSPSSLSSASATHAENSLKYDLFYGLSDRIFRATSGVSVDLLIGAD